MKNILYFVILGNNVDLVYENDECDIGYGMWVGCRGSDMRGNGWDSKY